MGKMSDAAFGDQLFDFVEKGQKAQSAVDAKIEGMKRVQENDPEWHADALRIVQVIPVGWVGIGEDVRNIVLARMRRPKHSNAWGALMGAAIAKKWFKPTGQWVSPKDVKSHSRPTREYRRI